MNRQLLAILAEAHSRMADREADHFSVAGSTFAIHAPDGLRQRLLAALAPRRIAAISAADVTIVAWGGKPTPMAGPTPEWDVPGRWSRGEAVRSASALGRVFFDPVGDVVALYDPERRIAGLWFADTADPAQWILAAPFLRLFDAWFTPRRMLMCHGAAVARHGLAALLIGPGGAGKSTLAIQAVGSGFGYIGDDYVLLQPGSGAPVVHSVYNSGKLFPDDLGRGVPQAVSVVQGPDSRADKFFLEVAAPMLLESAPVALVVEPRVGAASPSLTPISAGSAMRTLLPTALRQLPGDEKAKLGILERVLTVPCVRLDLSPDHGANLTLLDAALAREAARVH